VTCRVDVNDNGRRVPLPPIPVRHPATLCRPLSRQRLKAAANAAKKKMKEKRIFFFFFLLFFFLFYFILFFKPVGLHSSERTGND
jgi:hypothetical protein